MQEAHINIVNAIIQNNNTNCTHTHGQFKFVNMIMQYAPPSAAITMTGWCWRIRGSHTHTHPLPCLRILEQNK